MAHGRHRQAARLGTGIVAHAATIHLPRETLIPTPILPFTTAHDVSTCTLYSMPQHCNPNRPKAHTQPPEPPTSTTSRDSFWKCAATPAARSDETNATPPSSRESMDGMELSRHTQPPCPSHSPADCSRTGAETSDDEVNIEASRQAGTSLASHRLPLRPQPDPSGGGPTGPT